MKETLMREIVDAVMTTEHIRRAVRAVLQQRRAEAQRDATKSTVLLTQFDDEADSGDWTE